MARGFESKDVEFQQSEAARVSSKQRALSPAEREREARRRTTELALSRARAEFDGATNADHRVMLARAIEALVHKLQNR